RALHQTSAPPTMPVRSDEGVAERDEAAAEVLSVGTFTALQVLLAAVLYSPGLLAVVGVFSFVDVGTFFTTAGLPDFILGGFLLYLLGLATPFAALLWVMTIKLIIGRDVYNNNVTAGTYPKWSRMHLRVWFIGRLERLVLTPLGFLYRSAPLMAFALRQLGANVGKNLQCAHDAALSGPLDLITIGDDVAIQTGAYIHTARWSGQHLHVGPVRLESGCKIGMRAAVANGATVGRAAWITPVTPVLADVGAQGMWEGAPARRVARCTRLARTANACRDVRPIWLLEGLNLLMQVFIAFWLAVVPAAAILWLARDLIPADVGDFSAAYFMTMPLPEIVARLTLYGFVTTWLTIVVTSLLTCLFIRCTAARPGLYPSHGLRGALLLYRMSMMNRIQALWTWTITGQYLRALAGMHFPRIGGSECDVMFNLVPELTAADSVTFWSNGCFTNM